MQGEREEEEGEGEEEEEEEEEEWVPPFSGTAEEDGTESLAPVAASPQVVVRAVLEMMCGRRRKGRSVRGETQECKPQEGEDAGDEKGKEAEAVGEVFVDLGCGDARLLTAVAAAATEGTDMPEDVRACVRVRRAIGLEINADALRQARARVEEAASAAGDGGTVVEIVEQDIEDWLAHGRGGLEEVGATVVFMWLTPWAVSRLEPALAAWLRAGSPSDQRCVFSYWWECRTLAKQFHVQENKTGNLFMYHPL